MMMTLPLLLLLLMLLQFRCPLLLSTQRGMRRFETSCLWWPQVKLWITFNEPPIITILGYGQGAFAPGVSNLAVNQYIAGKNLILAHARTYRMYQQDFAATQQGGHRSLVLLLSVLLLLMLLLLFFFFFFFFFFFNDKLKPKRLFYRGVNLIFIPFFFNRLVGLVVKASPSRAEDPGFGSRLCRDFFGVESY